MGTNYFIEYKVCACCGEAKNPLHIGKKSSGWVFALPKYDKLGLVDTISWLSYLVNETVVNKAKIVNEYGDYHRLDFLLHLILNPHNDDKYGDGKQEKTCEICSPGFF